MKTPPRIWPVQQDHASTPRRPERRLHLAGEIQLRVRDPRAARTVTGKLIDISASGFCARYRGERLRPGVVVIAWEAFPLRVVWTRSSQSEFESGFERLDSAGDAMQWELEMPASSFRPAPRADKKSARNGDNRD